MVSFIRAYKTEINPTAEQKQKIHQTIGVCRFVYNFYIAHNKDVYEKQKRFVLGMDFSKWLNDEQGIFSIWVYLSIFWVAE